MDNDLQIPKSARFVVGLIEAHPILILLLALSCVGLLSPGMKRLYSDFTYRGFFNEGDALLERFDAFERQFGNDDAVVVAVHSPSGIFDASSAALLIELTEKMWLIPDVIRVTSLSNFNWVHAKGDEIIVEPLLPRDRPLTGELLKERERVATHHETIPHYLLSDDAKTAMLFAFVKPGIDAPPNNPKIVLPVRALLEKLKGGDHTFYLSGGPPLSLAFQEAATSDMQRLVPMVVLMTVLLLWVVLRSFAGVVLPMLVVGLSVVGSLAFAGWKGIALTNVTTALPQILISVGVADAMHILVTFYRGMKRGLPRRDAARYALQKNFIPTILTSLSTAIGFFSFATADLRPVADLGMLAGAGTVIAWFMTYGVVGTLLFVLPMHANKLPDSTIVRSDALVGRMVDRLRRARRGIILGFAAFTVIALAISTQNDVNSDPFKYFAEGYPTRIANTFIEDNVGGARGVEIVVDSGKPEGIKDPQFLRKVDALQTWLAEQPGVTRSVSIVDVLKQTHRSLHGDAAAFYAVPESSEAVAQELFLYTMGLPQGMDINDRVSIKNDRLRLTVLWTIPTSAEAVSMVHRIEEHAASMGLSVWATGKNLLWQALNGYVVRAFLRSMITATVLISLLLVVFFGSFSLGMLALVPNIIPLIGGGACLWLMGQHLDVGTVLVAAISLGIAVDDTIHILSNYRRARAAGHTSRDAIFEVLAHTGPALVGTTLVLVLAFGTFVFAVFTPNLNFGILTASVLSIALITDLVFLPALLMRNDAQRSEKSAHVAPTAAS